ncbi:MAG TPA: TonB-dependent receptor [Terracidiphilus sp.]|nr:TonB-dependent receptor [Terracidiphilus sp.]
MNKKIRTALVLALFACTSLVLLAPARAQSVYGSIFGTVTDSTGAAVPGATVTVTDEAKGTVVTATSNGSGDYTVPHLIPDVYDLKVTAKGFKTFETKGVQVEADTAPRIDPTMQVGGDTETVQVNADQEPELKTDKADVATVFDEQQVSSLPVGDQNFTNLQLLVPGAQKLGWSHAADENPQSSQQIQVDGQAFGGTAFELDGTDNQDPILGIIVINPTTDSVTETKITTQNYDAELGKAVSAVVTAQTQSGTNSFHGDIYDWRTGNANLARDPYSQPAAAGLPAGLKNRFGGTIGGPIKRDKAFFFFNWESQRQKVGTSATDTLPTTLLTESALGNTVGPSGIPGADFSEYKTQLGAAGTLYDWTHVSGGQPTPFPGNVIPTSYLSPQALALLKILEPYTKSITFTPGAGSVGNLDSNFHENGTGLFNSNQWVERVDYTLNEKAHIFERFTRFTDLLSGAVMFSSAGGPGFGINNYGGNSNGWNDSAAAGMDIALNPRLLTDFRLGYYRYNVVDQKHDQGTEFANQLGIPGINIGGTITSGAPGFVFDTLPGGGGGTNGWSYGDGLNINRCNCPLTEREDQFQVVNNWTKIVGNHTFKGGVDLRYARNLRVPSDSDRAGQLNFHAGPTADQSLPVQGGLSFASFLLGDVESLNRYVSTSTNAKEFQKRFFFYGQDTWRVTPKLTLNLGLRWDVYYPESVNAPGNGSLLNITDGYMHVAGIGGIGSNLGWSVDEKKQFAPRVGAMYQADPKTVVRAGYGRSFDTGVFGSVFGHTVTQNIPVLANQSVTQPAPNLAAFTLAAGPPAYVGPSVPSNGLLPAQGYSVSPSARPNPIHLTTIDAWNLAVQHALTPTMALTIAYVGNKGTHTLGDGDSNGTNPNEAANVLPGQYSVTGQTLNYDPNGQGGGTTMFPSGYSGGVSNSKYLDRYYGGKLAACSDPNYISLAGLQAVDGGDVNLQAGMCGWTSGIAYRGDDQNTEFDALQVTLNKAMSRGLNFVANYQWASAFDEQSGYYTWSHSLTHGRDSNTRDQQFILYGSYDLPFGKGRQFVSNANHALDLIIGGWQLSDTMNIAGGLPFSLSYNECGSNIADGPCTPNQSGNLQTDLSGAQTNSGGTITRNYYQASTLGGGLFTNPGLDTIGNSGINTYRGPKFFTDDAAFTKSFAIWEQVNAQFRMDAFNVFNHINAGNPSGNIESAGTISGEAAGCVGFSCGPRQVEFSARIAF